MGVGDDAPLVCPNSEPVDRLARRARWARPALEVQDEVRVGDERLAAIETWAPHRAGLVDRRAQVVLEVARALKAALSMNAVDVFLAVVLVQLAVRVEHLPDAATVVRKRWHRIGLLSRDVPRRTTRSTSVGPRNDPPNHRTSGNACRTARSTDGGNSGQSVG